MMVAGVMSGTSVDGIEVAILEFHRSFKVVGHHSVPFPPGVREAILAVSNTRTHTGDIARLNFLLGELFADAVIQTCEKIGVPVAGLSLIGSHGQTIFHEGDPVEFFGYQVASTMQIGEAAIIAKRTGVSTIADFRPDDIAAGGKGAPLVPAVDFRLFRHPEIARIALNIGGIANITVIPGGAYTEDIRAFDTGPGNMVMDALMGDARLDRDGETARSGRVNRELLDDLLRDPYYEQPPPKTAGREQYGIAFLGRFETLDHADALATAAELTVATIVRAVSHYPATREVIAAGGGVRNRYLMERLRMELKPRLMTSEDFGIPAEAKEAIAFAILAYESYHGRTGNVASATGAERAVILGKNTVP